MLGSAQQQAPFRIIQRMHERSASALNRRRQAGAYTAAIAVLPQGIRRVAGIRTAPPTDKQKVSRKPRRLRLSALG
ncbi:protein of unknown function [Cupriavidus neocaledonicus]|uniref:Uncharacterized protein n=1 Tax=Cupriavidus neocaledonicus TaxID=1040979 RepID=A0A375HDV3_9BURK|nr:hypothetical protein CBM2605_A310020 [Cupriavidus neocaledonicus]SPD48573.1 protein of unknown function [Cupriavidus neocaledonicus]